MVFARKTYDKKQYFGGTLRTCRGRIHRDVPHLWRFCPTATACGKPKMTKQEAHAFRRCEYRNHKHCAAVCPKTLKGYEGAYVSG